VSKPTVEDLVCKHCGKPADGAIYRSVEVTGYGWANVELVIDDDDDITAEVDDRVQEIEWDRSRRYEYCWGCSNCQTEKENLFNLVMIDDGTIDPVRWVQKHPPEGQQKLIP
jgi:hypothetical protein